VSYTRLTQEELRERKQRNARTAAALRWARRWAAGFPLVLSAPSCHVSGSSAARIHIPSTVKDRNHYRKQKSVLL